MSAPIIPTILTIPTIPTTPTTPTGPTGPAFTTAATACRPATAASSSTATTSTNAAAAAALIAHQGFDEAFVFWHARYADDPPTALAALAALARRAARDRRHQLAASYDAMHCALRRGSPWYPATLGARLLSLPQAPVSSGRLRHDAAQLDYLHQLGALGDEFPSIIAGLRLLAHRLEAGQPCHRELASMVAQSHAGDSSPLDQLDDVYDRIVHLRPTPCVAQALPAHTARALQAAQQAPGHGIVVIDDFLSAEALDELLRFCLQSTVWLCELGHGRLGASYEHGFNCPLLVQLLVELRELLPGMPQHGHALPYLDACKHPPRLPGEALQADQGDVKLQLWLTPDAANLDPATGGMFIRAPDGNTRYIAYRQNRAVLFPARLLHGAAARHFRDDHQGRRLDVNLRYRSTRYSTPSARRPAMASSS